MKNLVPQSLAFALLLTTSLCQAQGLPSGVTQVTSVEGITEYRLTNGLKVLLFPDPSKPNITVNMTYLVGSRQEGTGEGGMAHLLEHMVFKGSSKHPNIPQELTAHGSRPNGTTSWDRTNYFETFSASDENLRWALDLESDRMINSYIKKEDFDKEFSVVRNEFEMGENNAIGVTFEHTMGAAYLVHSYGRPVIGNKSDVERVPIDKLQAFFHKYYQPDNAVLTIAGKVDELKTVALVNEHFGKIPRPARVLTGTYTVEPEQDGERLTVVRRIGDVPAIFAMYHIPDGGHPDQPALDVLASVMGEQSSGRLYKALVDNKKAAQVFGNAMQLNEPSLIMFGAILNKADSVDDARTAMLATIDGVVKEPPSKEEVERAKTHLLKDIEANLRNSEQVGLFLSEFLSQGDWRLLFRNRDLLRQVTPQDVQRVATAYLKTSNRTIGECIPDAKPDRAEIPARTDIAAALKDYKGEAAMSAGEAFDASPKNIESRTERYSLPSGMKVALLPKKTRGASVHAVITLHFGDVEGLVGKRTIGSLVAETLIRGTAKKNRQQIQDEIDRLKAQMEIFGGATSVTVTIETTHENFPAVLGLAAEILKEATLPDTEFEQVRKLQLTQWEEGKTEPRMLAANRLSRILYPFPQGDVRATPAVDEQIEQIKAAKLDEAKAFYAHFYGSTHADLAAVGDFDPAVAKKAIGEAFSDWKSPARFERVKTGFQTIAAANESIETPDKKNAMFLAAFRVKLSDHDPDYPALVLGNFMLGGGFLNSRLATRIREKDGLSYGVGSRFTAKPDEQDAQFQTYAIAAPQNVNKVEAAFKEELALALKDGFALKEIDADRGGWLQAQQVTRAEDASLAQLLATRDYDNRTLLWDQDLETKVAALTPDAIGVAMRRNFEPGRLIIVKAGDFQKAAAVSGGVGKSQ